MFRSIMYSLVILVCYNANAQNSTGRFTEKVWRVNILNPAIELEVPTGKSATFSTAFGIGYGGAYPDLSGGGDGLIYSINPFLDVQYKLYYNFNKRLRKQKNIDNNSGNFLSARVLARGPSLVENVVRSTDYDFAIGPTWGLQRKYGKNFHLLFDIGPIYYFDTEGRGNIFPIMIQLNLGFDL
ncbi:hypothetical protein MNBD_BACTEROID03-1282 [hydrothermal vent metagenome]|uniref:Outer membrane protein beta-barrel domain-containing protein n=1 Tax=hydrothermal vent metagenome TaxID=652676 RepID=A0A3B0U5L4_9ZZZZ